MRAPDNERPSSRLRQALRAVAALVAGSILSLILVAVALVVIAAMVVGAYWFVVHRPALERDSTCVEISSDDTPTDCPPVAPTGQ